MKYLELWSSILFNGMILIKCSLCKGVKPKKRIAYENTSIQHIKLITFKPLDEMVYSSLHEYEGYQNQELFNWNQFYTAL